MESPDFMVTIISLSSLSGPLSSPHLTGAILWRDILCVSHSCLSTACDPQVETENECLETMQTSCLLVLEGCPKLSHLF